MLMARLQSQYLKINKNEINVHIKNDLIKWPRISTVGTLCGDGPTDSCEIDWGFPTITCGETNLHG